MAWYDRPFREPKVHRFIDSERIVPMLWEMTNETPENFKLLESLGAKVPGLLWYPAGEGNPMSLDGKNLLANGDQLIRAMQQAQDGSLNAHDRPCKKIRGASFVGTPLSIALR
jgi:hypothetical protein